MVAIWCNLMQIAKPLHVWAPPHSTTGLLQHVKRLSTASANKTERTWKNTIFLLRLSTKSILQLASRVAGLTKTFPEVLSLSTMPPRLPRRTWNYVKLFVTFPRHCITLEVTWRAFSLAMCVLALKIFHPATLMVRMLRYVFALLTFDGWIFCDTPGWFWVDFFDFVRFCEWDLPLV